MDPNHEECNGKRSQIHSTNQRLSKNNIRWVLTDSLTRTTNLKVPCVLTEENTFVISEVENSLMMSESDIKKFSKEGFRGFEEEDIKSQKEDESSSYSEEEDNHLELLLEKRKIDITRKSFGNTNVDVPKRQSLTGAEYIPGKI